MENEFCWNEKDKELCLCRKCIGKCYINDCKNKIAVGGMCKDGVVTKCDQFEEMKGKGV